MEICLNKNQKKVFNFLLNNEGGWFRVDTIRERLGFEKRGTVTGCLLGLESLGLVERINQPLYDGSVMKFWRLGDISEFHIDFNMTIKI